MGKTLLCMESVDPNINKNIMVNLPSRNGRKSVLMGLIMGLSPMNACGHIYKHMD